jgi:hypothetical protein
MKRLVRAATAGLAASLASWLAARWLERRAARSPDAARAIQVWENEGGNPAPQRGASPPARPD